jgi:ABC-type polysaccharide/polyol phosphate transport system ATPase subunit
MTDKDIAIKVENVSKAFRIPHEKISSLRGAFVNLFGDKGYEEFKALDNVSFRVKKGEFFGIIGRNGSGKSTLLKILAGIYKPDEGRVKINGLISPFLELGIGFNPELSGRDNIYLNAAVLGLTHKQIDEKFDDIVRFSELKRFIDQKVKNYSSGMQVRLAFSVAIHANRDILLMDEVLAVGDANFQQKCISEFTKYKHLGKTVVLVTHDIATVQKYCDRAMLLRDGKIKMIGDPGKVSSEYIYQNMTDEEKRLFEEEKERRKKAEKEVRKRKEKFEKKQQKIASITKVEFLNADGQSRKNFLTGDDLSVRVYFRVNEPKKVFNFGIGLYNEQNEYISGIHTLLDKIETDKYVKKGFVQLDLKKIPIKSGAYFVKASICGDDTRLYFDFLDKSDLFRINTPGLNQEGIFNMEYKWHNF